MRWQASICIPRLPPPAAIRPRSSALNPSALETCVHGLQNFLAALTRYLQSTLPQKSARVRLTQRPLSLVNCAKPFLHPPHVVPAQAQIVYRRSNVSAGKKGILLCEWFCVVLRDSWQNTHSRKVMGRWKRATISVCDSCSIWGSNCQRTSRAVLSHLGAVRDEPLAVLHEKEQELHNICRAARLTLQFQCIRGYNAERRD